MKKFIIIFLFFTIKTHSQNPEIRFAPKESLYSAYGTALLDASIKHLKDTINKWKMMNQFKYFLIVTEAGVIIENEYFGVKEHEAIARVNTFEKGFYDVKNIEKTLETLKTERVDFWKVSSLDLPDDYRCIVFRRNFIAKSDEGECYVFNALTDAIFIYKYDRQKHYYIIEDIKLNRHLLE